MELNGAYRGCYEEAIKMDNAVIKKNFFKNMTLEVI